MWQDASHDHHVETPSKISSCGTVSGHPQSDVLVLEGNLAPGPFFMLRFIAIGKESSFFLLTTPRNTLQKYCAKNWTKLSAS